MFQDKLDFIRERIGVKENDAIYIGIAFLDTFLNYSQGLVVLAFFGLESSIVFDPLKKWFDTVQGLYYERSLSARIEKDPRLYHWTLRLVSSIISRLPHAEDVPCPTERPEVSYLKASVKRKTLIM